MPETVAIRKDLGIIEVRSTGHVTLDEIRASMERIEGIVRETGLYRVLVDARESKTIPGTVSLFELASSLPRNQRIAVLVQDTQPVADDIHFMETVAYNRGLSVRRFTSQDEALAWLNEK